MWRAEDLTKILQLYRSSNAGKYLRVYDNGQYSVYLDSNGNDHYQNSDRNPKRPIQRRDGTWEFKTSTGKWESFEKTVNSKIEKAYQSISSMSHSGKKRKHQASSSADPPMSQPRVDDDEGKFLSLMTKIKENPNQFAMIYTDQKNSLDFKAKFSGLPGRRGTNLRKEQKNFWRFIENRSDTRIRLLIPPRKYDSTDISDFAKRYDEKAWKELFVQIRTRLSNKDYWVYTHGGGEDILHIRFEPGPQRKYKI